MGNIIAIMLIVVILGLAITYIVRAKKKGVTCIGCPSGGSCSGHCGGSCSSDGCSCGEDAK